LDVFGGFFPCRFNRLFSFHGKPGRRSIKEQESKEAIGRASARNFHGIKRNAQGCEMSKRLRLPIQRTHCPPDTPQRSLCHIGMSKFALFRLAK